jgi:NAD(P)-dependent dehydrogenase (short-subunit alcohol dehydrogenase family)
MSVNDRVAVITGSGSGIGESIAKMLASNGAKVIINDLDQEKIDRVVADIKEKNGTAIGIMADVTNPEEVKNMIENSVGEFGRLDILVNNAGIARDKTIRGLSLEDWDKVIDTNLKSVFLTCQAAAHHMIDQKYGRIINISSRAWLGFQGQSNYSASKGGVVSLTRTLALELAKHQITSNVICPGLIDTPLLRSAPQKVIDNLIKLQPTRSVGKPEDIANGVLFFAADESSYITGQTFFICGGKSLFSSLSV